MCVCVCVFGRAAGWGRARGDCIEQCGSTLLEGRMRVLLKGYSVDLSLRCWREPALRTLGRTRARAVAVNRGGSVLWHVVGDILSCATRAVGAGVMVSGMQLQCGTRLFGGGLSFQKRGLPR